MKVIHVAENTDGYEIVSLLANNVSRNNHFTLIEKDGVMHMTGGFIINDTPRIRAIFDALPKEDHYKFAKEFKSDPWVRSYADEPYGDQPAIEF